jgi:hypothetical protein
MTGTLNGWHPGEQLVRHKLNYDTDPSLRTLYTYITTSLDPHQALFHSNNVSFLPITTLDADGRPWGSVLAPEDGRPGIGFIDHQEAGLRVRARLWDGDPLKEYFEKEDEMLVAGIGIEFSTRRRNKFAGKITRIHQTGDVFDMDFSVNESVGYVIPYPFHENTSNF